MPLLSAETLYQVQCRIQSGEQEKKAVAEVAKEQRRTEPQVRADMRLARKDTRKKKV